MLSGREDDGFVLGEVYASKQLFTELQPYCSSSNGVFNLVKARRDGKWFIIKCLNEEFRNSAIFQSLLKREFDYLYNLDHPNIVKVYSWEEIPGFGGSIVQEYVDGMTLDRYINSGYITGYRALKIVEELSSALNYIHRKQIVHRDIHPQNILITHNGNHVKLIDFGLALSDDVASMRCPAGTQRYISPEIIAGEEPDGRSDIYSVGCIIEDLFSGKPSGSFKRVATKCMANDKEKRYRYADEIYADLTAKRGHKKVALLFLLLMGIITYLFIYFYQVNEPVEEEFVQVIKEEPLLLPDSSLVNNEETLPLDKNVKEENTTLKPASTSERGELILSYGKYVGEIRNGLPHGKGELTYSVSYLINLKDENVRYSEKGDIFVGKFNNGVPEYGKLYNSDRELKATMIFGRSN